MNFDKTITKKLSVDSVTSLFSRIWYKLKDSVSQRKRRLQRAAKGYCDRDLFMLSSWFFGIIPEMLEEIKKKRLGVSTHYIMENRESFGIKSFEEYLALSEEEHSKIAEVAAKKWEETLSDIIF